MLTLENNILARGVLGGIPTLKSFQSMWRSSLSRLISERSETEVWRDVPQQRMIAPIDGAFILVDKQNLGPVSVLVPMWRGC